MVSRMKCKEKKAAALGGRRLPAKSTTIADVSYFFLPFAAAFSRITACAAASRAIGTRYGEHDT